MLKAIYQLFFSFHKLSLDVALGACAMMHFVASLLLIQIPPHYYFLLAFGTLIIYWTDHLLDTQNALLVQTNLRHWLFKKYKRVFYAGITLLIFINAYLAMVFLSKVEILSGLLLFVGLSLYLFYHKKLKRLFILEKELLISTLYVVSILFAPIAIFDMPFLSFRFFCVVIIGLNLLLMTLQNLFSIAVIEREMDRELGIKNITQIYGSSKIRDVQLAMLLLQIIASAILGVLFPAGSTLLFCLVLLGNATFQYLLPVFFKQPKNQAYHILGDAFFILPLLFSI